MTYLDRFERVDWPPEYRPPCPACGTPLAGLRDLPLDASGTRIAAFAVPCGHNVNLDAQALQAAAPTYPDIVTFLERCIAEDEAAATVATPGPWRIDTQHSNVILEPWPIDSVGVAGARTDPPCPVFTGQTSSRTRRRWEADAQHIARWDPARVLRLVESQRKILVLLAPPDPHDVGDGYPDCAVLYAMAQQYTDRPGFSPAWRTTP